MRFKFTPALVVTSVLACVGAAAASVGLGQQGAVGAAALTGVQTVESAPVDIPSGSSSSVHAYCPSGMRVIGTGFFSSLTNVGFVKAYGSFVGGFFINNSPIPISVHVQAICALDTSGLTALSRGEDFERDVRQLTEQSRLEKQDAR
ncbi:hypothetical protein BO221_12475 [Archangium sp. Cb G35]|uniref:hypothetical protein n=1 Tax=Archangium sp. Cb G35 TaxID=1920190 RepID=UPI000935ED2A|nr:hypothetical protein [Archangium sp. Cb G35]OJT25181.1 hypothetical protein BO221_12475 [Archangium sp. Cb G35]